MYTTHNVIVLQPINIFHTELNMRGLGWDSIIAKRDNLMMPYTGMWIRQLEQDFNLQNAAKIKNFTLMHHFHMQFSELIDCRYK